MRDRENERMRNDLKKYTLLRWNLFQQMDTTPHETPTIKKLNKN